MTKEEILELRNKVINHPNVSEEEKRRVLALIDQGQTYGFDSGFSSIDRQWLKYYDDDAEEKIYNIPQNKSVWDVIEEKLIEHYDIPALAYFFSAVDEAPIADTTGVPSKLTNVTSTV